MRLVCPGCGLTASAEAWGNDVAAREAMAAIIKLPAPVADQVLPYLALFRPPARALTWKKVGRLVADLAAMVATGHVQKRGRVARPCPPRIWAEAMEKMVLSPPSGRLKTNHNYLREVAWDLADRADAAGEKVRIEKERSGMISPQPDDEPLVDVKKLISEFKASRPGWD